VKVEASDARLHRLELARNHPYLLIDGILEIDDAPDRIRAAKAFSFSEPYFAGHFPGKPVVPGILLMMAMVQAAELLRGGRPVRLLEARRFHFRAPVQPGDLLVIDLETAEEEGESWTVRGTGSVRGELHVKGTLVLGSPPTDRAGVSDG
jgi:3-hydroxyacyl-[acyl-carrier-protein] dehydratase